MSGWSKHHGVAVHLPLDNIDTDQIIPARFMSQPRIDGYQDFLFYDLRRDNNGEWSADFPVNRTPDASILLCTENFGIGSSREAAAYALVDANFKVVVALSFGDIFSANAVNNGLLPATVDERNHGIFRDAINNSNGDCIVDLERCTLTCCEHTIDFTIDEAWRTKLINGWDDIDLTLSHAGAISAFGTSRRQQFSWAWPGHT